VNKQKAFTLIELLVVISIIALLLSILIPSLQKAKELTMRVVCASNLRQCGLSLLLYANDNEDDLPFIDRITNSDGCQPSIFQSLTYTSVNLSHILEAYIGDFKIWRCPSISRAAIINDPRNTRNISYCTYYYFPSRKYPTFGDSETQPKSFTSTKSPTLKVMMQDYYLGNIKFETVYYNHGKGSAYQSLPEINPSYGYKSGILYKDGNGANLLFYDGHVNWYNFKKLEDIGSYLNPKHGYKELRIFSRLNR
jgi:prepilin-type N-terminal cleavage/methylation domain-containing protein/prepilin-type processing-associated H-X9-DG protein